MSPDGHSVYIPAFDGQTLFVFRRENGPTCGPTSLSTAHHAPVTVTLTCADSDGDPVSYSIVSAPAHGTLGAIDQSAGTVTYTPAATYGGPDRFTFSASDGTTASAPASTTITVAAAPPSVVISSPGNGGSYTQGTTINASYSCTAGAGTTLSSCTGSVTNGAAINTRTPGTHEFTVTATDSDGQDGAQSLTYAVTAKLPSITHLSQTHRHWREHRSTGHAAPEGTAFVFTLSAPARVSLSFAQHLPGRNVKGKCMAQTVGDQHRPKCERTVTRGTLTVAAHTGENKVAFAGRISHSVNLAPGTYTLTVLVGTTGQSSRPQKLDFTVVS